MDFQALKVKWATLSLGGKIIVVITFPILVFFAFLKFWGSWNQHQDNALNASITKQDEQLKKEEGQVDAEISKTEGTLDQIRKDEDKAKKEAEGEDADDFYNHRKYPRDDQ